MKKNFSTKIQFYAPDKNLLQLEKLREKVGRKFRKFIQLRDLVKLPSGDILAKCISCQGEQIIDNSYQLKYWHAGHYFKEKGISGSESVALDEDNVHLQCARCNIHLNGNESNYEENLRRKIGNERFVLLQQKRREIKKYSLGELQELDRFYSAKLKTESKRLDDRGIKRT